MLEIPSGLIEPDESPEQAAIRETAEETAVRVESCTPLGFIYSSVGLTNERIHLFFADRFSILETEAELPTRWMRPDEALKAFGRESEPVDAKTAVAVARAAELLRHSH